MQNPKPSKQLQVGITGGIGSGKTTISKFFATLGVPVYYADDSAKWLMQNDLPLIEAIQKEFGQDIYSNENTLNRQQLASIVFNDTEALRTLESLVHPAVFRHTQTWAAQHPNAPYLLREAALTFESGSYKMLDKVITVFAPKEVRIQRVLKRDSTNRGAIEARMDKQWADEKKVELADFVIVNDGEKLLIPQVLQIHRTLSGLDIAVEL
ncbi:MAG: dephospho-CoA kinase [Chitinophagales bacterium]